MTYTLLPNSGQSLGQTRAPIRTNFQLIQSAQDANHVALGVVGAGKHKFLQMPEQPVLPTAQPTTAVNEAALYAQVGTTPAETNLFLRGENNGFVYQLTNVDSTSTGTFGTTTAPDGWTFLPGNLIFQFGAITAPGNSGTVTFPRPFSTAYYSITFGLSRSNSSSVTNAYIDNNVAVSTTSFAYTNVSTNTDPIYWMAIGN